MYIHDNDGAHRDIKPANLLLFKKPGNKRQFYVKLTDIGAGKYLDAE